MAEDARLRRTAWAGAVALTLLTIFGYLSNGGEPLKAKAREEGILVEVDRFIATPTISLDQDPTACVLTSNPVLSGYDVVVSVVGEWIASFLCLTIQLTPETYFSELTQAYHSIKPDGDAVAGDSAFEATYKGYTFHFSSETNRKMFEKEPVKYLPQWGKC